MPEKDLPFEIVWLEDLGAECGRERIEAYDLDRALMQAAAKLHKQKGPAAPARGFLVRSIRLSQDPENPPDDEARVEAITNIRQAIRVIAPLWEDMKRFGHSGADDVAGAQSDLEQAIRFLTGEEEPS